MTQFPIANLFSHKWCITQAGWETARYNLMERPAQGFKPGGLLQTPGIIGSVTSRGVDIFGNAIPGMEVNGHVATIPVNGIIAANIGPLEKTFGFVDVFDLEHEHEIAMGNPMVREIHYTFDSPGGYIVGVPEFADKIAADRQEKYILASAIGECCSAAYWLAAGATEITAGKTSDVGSIGVFQAVIDYSRMYQNAGVDVEVIKSGKFKGQGYPGTEVSDEYKAHLQTEVNQIFNWFVVHVTSYRRVKAESMQGQSFLGNEALSRSLVDAIN